MSSYEKLGIEYDSNYYFPDMKNIQPFFFKWVNVLEIPIFFSDIGYFYNNNRFNLNNIDLDDNGFKVFLFHPFHIFMNTSSVEHYNKLKPYFNNEEYLFSHRKPNDEGIGSLFTQLLEFIKKNQIETLRMDKINEIFRMNEK